MLRTRRLRKSEAIRRLVRETILSINDFVYPLFIEEGTNIETEIASMPGIKRFSLDTIVKELDEVVALKIPAVLLFGIPSAKDDEGTETWNENGIIQKAIRFIKQNYPDLYDMYYFYQYNIKLVKILYNINEKKPIETYLDKDKYYLCKYIDNHDSFWFSRDFFNTSENDQNQILFGFKKITNDYVTKICDIDSKKNHTELLFWNPKIKIMNLLLQEKIINFSPSF